MKESRSDILLKNTVLILKKLRKEKGLSHEVLAKRAGVTRPAISFLESGSRKPSLLTCLKLADALETTLAQILLQAESNHIDRK